MIHKTIFSGFGGQGVLMMGYSLANGAMDSGYNVTFLPSYGAEMRGGTANCTVCVGDEEIASPIASTPDHLVVMNIPSLYSFQNRVVRDGIIFLNSSIVDVTPVRKDVKVIAVDCVKISQDIGDARMANVVMMGAFIKETKIITPDNYLKSLEKLLGKKKKSVVEMNQKAFMVSYEMKRENK
ncbi:MAG: 2-oxoacid:acceptor oxidoreductase family protein [Deltaproteobacteria bacterium]